MANRYSPTVRPDDRTDRRPGLEVADAFDQQRQERIQDALLEQTQIDRDRRRGREDTQDAASELAFEKWIEDNLGGRRVEPDVAGPGAAGRTDPVAADPELTRPLFEQARIGMQRGTEQGGAGVGIQPPADPQAGKVAVLPGQFMGGQFAQELIRVPEQPQRRTIAGQDYMMDPSRTRESRDRARVESEKATDIEALVASGIPEPQARAMVEAAPGAIPSHLQRRDPASTRALDPMKGEFDNDEARNAFIDFRRRLALADAAGRVGRAPGDDDGPITVEDALAELDQMYGEFDRSGNLIGHRLNERERFDLAIRWSQGRLNPDDLPLPEPEAVEEPEEQSGGYLRNLWNAIRGRGGAPEEEGMPSERNATAGQDVTLGPDGPAPTTNRGTSAPTGDAAADTARAIIREFPNVPPNELREILISSGVDPAVVDQVLGGGR